ncbi:MAG: putative PHD type zinc finger protein with BAH domain-containing protein [Thelocarpon impressellum]|nr:MAG: putative PHD type zinc finger protein with BAH domain-containing protein [Thelocarpon impressellum]
MADEGDAPTSGEPEAAAAAPPPTPPADARTPAAEDGQASQARQGSEVPQPSSTSAVNDSASQADSREPANPSGAKVGSEPMLATSSSSSITSMKDGSKDGSAGANGTASPYGTRSRKRTGGVRPNYAEDVEMEAEYDQSGTANGTKATAKPPRSGEAPASGGASADRPHSGISTRRTSAALANGSSAATAGPSPSQSSSKDYIPGTSSFSANPSTITAPATKKRRTAGTTSISANQLSTTGTSSGGQITTRKASTLASSATSTRMSNMMTFETSQGHLKHGKLRADDGTALGLNDHVYLICEPPGEPYYLARIMEFLHKENDQARPIDAIRVNWYYRPRDIQRKVTDTRVVFASMHSDTCPLTSLRGKCRIMHRTEIQELDQYRKTKDCFWYEKMYDRYSHRYYEVIPTSQVINVPIKVKRVLDERWRFVIVEIGRGKELTSAVKSCKRCAGYCASNDSVECAVCHMTYHMNCVRPPLLKKPSRGFAWACAPCSRMQERKLEARNTPLVGEAAGDVEEEEVFDEEEEEGTGGDGTAGGTSSATSENHDATIHPATAEQIAHAKQWPYRYLGIHCRVEDALDYDDRIYPRASSRLGPRHQANVTVWQGRPVELVKPAEIRRKYVKGSSHKKDAKLSKETVAAMESEKVAKEKRPKWVMDEPAGYIRRGDDHANDHPEDTARLAFGIPEVGEGIDLARGGHESEASEKALAAAARERTTDEYMSQAKKLAKDIGVKPYSTNFLDKALSLLCEHDFDVHSSLKALKTVNRRKDLREPELNKDEQKRFEEGVSKFGSELHSVTKHVRTQKEADIVRYYYMWKKTERGKLVWGGYEGRKGKKEAKRAEASSSKLVDDVADDHDDSAFDSNKASERKRGFACKFCGSQRSNQWRRAPAIAPGTTIPADPNGKGNSKDKGVQLVVALCRRCAELWRRYGIQWEDIDEVARKVAQGGGRAWKRRIDEELLKLLVSPEDVAATSMNGPPHTTRAPVSAAAAPPPPVDQPSQEPTRRKMKAGPEKEAAPAAAEKPAATTATTAIAHKKKVVEKPEGPPPAPEMPKPKILPCAICDKVDPMDDQHLACKECRMTVHRNCYGVVGEVRSANKWVCDMCSNDKNPQVSTSYECVLCPVRYTDHDFVEPPKISHKKKTDKERERERVEREVAVAAAEFYRKKQEEMHRPLDPREPLKRTAGNNWVHVTCAVWTTEMKFGNAKALEPSEGIGTIAPARYEQVFHVECAHHAGYTIGFDITPVKSSRRDLVNVVTLGNETGSMTAAIWCKEHAVKTIVHPLHEVVDDSGLNALQLFVRNYKQADLTLTGTVRKANLVNQSTKAIGQGVVAGAPANRRTSTSNAANGGPPATPLSATRPSIKAEEVESDEMPHVDRSDVEPGKEICTTCGIDVSPKWWKVGKRSVTTHRQEAHDEAPHSNGYVGNGDRHYSSVSRSAQNHVGTHVHLNGYSNGDVVDSAAALAAAALTVETQGAVAAALVQCHKCHWKKQREPSPIVAPLYQAASRQAPESASPRPLPPQSVRPPPPVAAPLPPTGHFQSWSHQPAQPPPPPQDVPPRAAPIVHHVNGHSPHSPHHFGPSGPRAVMNGGGAMRAVDRPMPAVERSQPPQRSPRQPHHHHSPPGPPPLHLMNAPPPSHTAHLPNGAQPPHMMNGSHHHQAQQPMMHGPPPPPQPQQHRPADGHFSHQPRPPPPHQHSRSYGGPHERHDRRQMSADRPTTPRETLGHGAPNGPPSRHGPSDGRAAGGASASPSLRNLLS